MGSGALQGDVIAGAMYLEAAHPAVDQWMQQTVDPVLVFVDPVLGEEYDVSVATYADDNSKTHVAQTVEEMRAKLEGSNAALDEA
eukprot:12585476-Alexandrium_andersonii.AAC.1